jgi:hypothetical protein
MRRIANTVFAIIAIAIVIFIMAQAQNTGAPWIFTAVGILVIILIVFSMIRTWLRR